MEPTRSATGAYPGTERESRVPPDLLHQVVSAIFGKCSMAGEDAARLADTLVVADLQGVHSHGVLRVPDYVQKLTEGGVDPRGRPRVVTDAAAAIVVDGGNSMGQIGATFAMRRAIEAETERGYRREGIPLNAATLEGVAKAAAKLGAELPAGFPSA